MVSLQVVPLSASSTGDLLMWLWLDELSWFLLVSSASSMLWQVACTLAYQWSVTAFLALIYIAIALRVCITIYVVTQIFYS
jgi:hypothetical protein